MTDTTEPTGDERDAILLEKTQNLRVKLLDAMSEDISDVLKNKTTAETFIALTGAIDAQVFNKRRSKAQDDSNKNQEALRAAALETLKALRVRQVEQLPATEEERSLPEVDYRPVVGETDINPPKLSYEEIMKE